MMQDILIAIKSIAVKISQLRHHKHSQQEIKLALIGSFQADQIIFPIQKSSISLHTSTTDDFVKRFKVFLRFFVSLFLNAVNIAVQSFLDNSAC